MKILRKFRALVVNERTAEIRLRNITGMVHSQWYETCQLNNPTDHTLKMRRLSRMWNWFEAIEDNDPWSPTWQLAISSNNPKPCLRYE